MNDLSPGEVVRIDLLLRFLAIAKDGIVKPYDPSYIITKLGLTKEDIKSDSNIGSLIPSSDVRDSKDYRPYILAALKQINSIMDLEVEPFNNNYNERRQY